MLNPKDSGNSSLGLDINSFYDYFKNENDKDKHDNSILLIVNQNASMNIDTYYLNNNITIKEVVFVIFKLKQNKAVGIHLIENDYLTDSFESLGPLYPSYFNLVFFNWNYPRYMAKRYN